ncbi:MAG: hypothetical protein VX681_03095 [Myxococcota bacterium]|nr:hypothetical protein [Myxococcota bacterium]
MSEPQSPPRLSVVEPPPVAESAPPRRSRLPWLLGVAALGFAWLWLDQLEHTQRVERQVYGLESELASARDDLVAWEARMQDVRSGIEGLVSQLESLRSLVAPAPVDALLPDPGDADLPSAE